MLDSLLQALKTGHDHVALTGRPLGALHRFAGRLIESLELERSLRVENHVPGETDALLARFNQLIAGLSADQAFAREASGAPASLIFVVHVERETQAGSVLMLARLCNALPGARARILLIIDEATRLDEFVGPLGARVLSVEVTAEMAAQALAKPLARALPGAALVDDDAFANDTAPNPATTDAGAGALRATLEPAPERMSDRKTAEVPALATTQADPVAQPPVAEKSTLRSRLDFRRWPLAGQMSALVLLGLAVSVSVHWATDRPTAPAGKAPASAGAAPAASVAPKTAAAAAPAPAPAAAVAPSSPPTPASAPVAAPTPAAAPAAAPPKSVPNPAPAPSAAATSTQPAATPASATTNPKPAAPVAPAPAAGTPAQPTAPPSAVAPAAPPFACTPSSGSVPRFQARQPSKAADMVYLMSTVRQRVCVTGADGSLQEQVLDPEVGRSFYGKQPLQVQAEQMRNLRVFFQGARIPIPVSAGDRIELVER